MNKILKLSLVAITLMTGMSLLFTKLDIDIVNTRYIIDDRIIIPADSIPKYVKDWMDLRQNQKNLSKLGRILFLGEKEPNVKQDKIYKILIWKHGPLLEERFLQRYNRNTPAKDIDPFENCSVNNCALTYNDIDLATADIVIFHLHKTKNLEELPKNRGKKGQIWTFLTDESPHHTFSGLKTFRSNGKVYTIEAFNGIFNWSMSYRTQSDIPVPYGRTIVKKNLSGTNANFTKRRDILVAIMGSNCRRDKNRSIRWDYVEELQKHIRVDVYGKCGTLKCPGHISRDCSLLNNYLFYLAFENSNCNEYVTEKLWWNAYHKNSIPIVMGGGKEFYKRLLPPNSYLNVEDFASPASLASYILKLNETNKFVEYYKWRMNFEVLNEHGCFHSRSFHYCRVCQAMNYNDKSEKIYTHLEDQYDVKSMCHPGL